MTEIRRETQQHSGINLSDILFALFKRKRTIILCAVVGIIAAAAFYFFYPPVYRVTGQVAGALCSGKERHRPDRGRESCGRVKQLRR